ncbi:AAA family ATPase [Aureispira anguillae]|uniref:AAA family ATPase n=1 Tax=Aureispira anguillae TaxID=2864201 RepID=A0A915YL98_9BACT|nr:AAA family ATPase [Aureispira anguillae]BDS15188.1 AAA family ATPase [Aureispira anguillae]
MLTKLHIENFKSIHNLEIELGKVNVFIGENGCGKSNILEAVALASAAKSNRLRNDDLAAKGIRVTRPDMMMNSFLGVKSKKNIRINISKKNQYLIQTNLIANSSDITTTWVDEYSIFDNPSFMDLKDVGNIVASNMQSHSIFDYIIYELQTNPLRGFNKQSLEVPGRNGENLDLLLEKFTSIEWQQLLEHSKFISWLDDNGIMVDKDGDFASKRLKLRSDSKLYFRDKFMQKKNNIFSVENANEGALHILFYLALFISQRTPQFFAIDNIENALNPNLCRHLMKNLASLANKNQKQALITTHNPAILDGLNLHDDEQRLFVVSRNKKGHTIAKRIQLKPSVEIGGKKLKLSELWMRNHLGGIPQNF